MINNSISKVQDLGQRKKIFGGSLSTVAFLIIFFSVFNFSVPTAQAVQIKKIYRSFFNFRPGETSGLIALGNKVNPAKTIVLISSMATNTTTSAHGERNFFFTAQLAGDDKVQIDRGAGDVNASIALQIIEFADGLQIQSGVTDVDPGVLTKTVTLPPISPALDLTRSVPIVTFRTTTGGTATTSYDRTNEFFLEPVLSQVAGNTTLTFKRLKASVTAMDKPITVAWQVVEFQTDAKVYSGMVSMPVPLVNGVQSATNDGSDPDSTGPLLSNAQPFNPPLSDNGDNALLFFYPKYGTQFVGEDAQIFIRGTITNDKTVTFSRGYGTSIPNTAVAIRFYIVDFMDGSGISGGLGKGLKGSFNATDEPPLKTISSSLNKSPITNTTTSPHSFAVDDFINVSGVNGNAAANGTWLVKSVPSTVTFTMKDLSGSQVDGTGGSNGTTGKTAKASEANLTSSYVTLDPTRLITMASASATDVVSADETSWADDLSFINYLYQKNAAWYLVSIRDSDGRATAAVQDYWTYEFPALTLKAPNGGNVWIVDSQQTIAWVHADSAADHDWQLEISLDGGANYTPMIGTTYGWCGAAHNEDCTQAASGVALSVGNIPWKVSDSVGTDVKIRLVDLTDTTPDTTCKRHCDASNATFAISGSITNVVVKHSGVPSNVLYVGDTVATVSWTQLGSVGTVRIEIDTDGDDLFGAEDNPADVILKTGQSTGASGDYNWIWIPSVGNYIGEDRKIRVIAENDAKVESVTPPFAVRPTINILEPAAGAKWFLGKLHTIEYCTTGTVGNIKVYLSSNSGSTYDYRLDSGGSEGVPATTNLGITANCKDKGAQWDLTIDPATPVGNTSKIKIEKFDQTEIYDTGPDTGVFEIIKPSLSLIDPSTTDVLKVGVNNPISWTVRGEDGISTVSIKYTTSWSTCQNNPGDHACWVTLKTPDASSLPVGSSPFLWNVGNIAGTDIGIRIQDSNNGNLVYDKRGPFKVEEKALPNYQIGS